MELCILCSNDIGIGEVVIQRQKEIDSINKASKLALVYTNRVDLIFRRYLNINNVYFDNMVSQIYPSELQRNKANTSDTEAPF